MRGVDRIETIFYFFVESLPEIFGGKFEAGFDQARVFLNRKIGILILVVEYPALAFGDDLVAEFVSGEFVSPFAECAFGEFLDVAFVDEVTALFLFLRAC